jgi:RNA polymerase primary sigma factor
MADKVGKDEMRIDELVDGLIDSSGEDIEAPWRENEADWRRRGRRGDDEGGAVSAPPTWLQLKADALERFAAIHKCCSARCAPRLPSRGIGSKVPEAPEADLQPI